jgi:hypothetical protein
MPLPRTERLRIIQEVHKEWQKIYGSRDDSEAEIANYDMIIEATKKAEEEWDAVHPRVFMAD